MPEGEPKGQSDRPKPISLILEDWLANQAMQPGEEKPFDTAQGKPEADDLSCPKCEQPLTFQAQTTAEYDFGLLLCPNLQECGFREYQWLDFKDKAVMIE